jgi:hypothetical protein
LRGGPAKVMWRVLLVRGVADGATQCIAAADRAWKA